MSDELYPVYVTLFSNNGQFSKLIRKATGSQYSHATISLEPSMNAMYSFTDIPYANSRSLLSQPAGFVKESIYGPGYSHNLYFTVLITFVDKLGYDEIKKKIDFFIKNHTKYRYNDIGLIQYFFNMKSKKNPNEIKKAKWFCSEFVAYMLKSGGIPGIDTVMEAPQDLYDKSSLYVESIDYTITDFREDDLIAATERAKRNFIASRNKPSPSIESYIDSNTFYEEAMEVALPFRKKKLAEWDLMNYTTNIDWKYLHEKFLEIFNVNNMPFKFDIIELIIRKFIQPMKVQSERILDYIVQQFSNIRKIIDRGSITFVDVKKGIINYISSSNKAATLVYDPLEKTYENYALILENYIIPLS